MCMAFYSVSLNAQKGTTDPVPPQHPCDTFTLGFGLSPSQSSTEGMYKANIASDGNTQSQTFSRTNNELNPWWQLDLGQSYNVKSVKIFRPSNGTNTINPTLENYYILVSEQPFGNDGLNDLLQKPYVRSGHVANVFPSGDSYALDLHGRYVRVQLNSTGVLELSEVQVQGSASEICGDGIDNDCDGLIDCADSDCRPSLVNVAVVSQPTCPICQDGVISIQAGTNNISNLRFSIDNGVTFFSSNSWIKQFDHLPVGTYNIVVKDIASGCTTTWPKNPVNLSAPVGNPVAGCPNGDFEEGTFNHWIGGLGTNTGPDFVLNANGFALNTRHTIIQSMPNVFDPVVGGTKLPLASPNNGLYFVKLGNSQFGGQAEKLAFNFTVDNSNKDFYFNYALVLGNGDHPKSMQPYFQWKFYKKSDGTIIDIKMNGKNLTKKNPDLKWADPSDEFFLKKSNNNQILYKGWTCYDLDLSEFLGQELVLEFISADCSEFGHFGYGYIDDICVSASAVVPNLALNLNESYCKNQKVDAKIVGGQDITKYSWKISRGNEFFLISETVTYEGVPDFNDILGWYFASPHRPNIGLTCGDKFKVELSVSNDCSSKTITKEFTYRCEENNINYPDIVFCKSPAEDLKILGTNDCVGCQVAWTPSQFLNNATIPNPIILGTNNTNALAATYHIKVKNSVGCVYEDDVKVNNIPELLGNIVITTEIVGYCEFNIKATITFANPTIGSAVIVNFVVDGLSYTGISTTPAANLTTHTFLINPNLNFSRGSNHTIYVTARMSGLPQELTVYGNCTITQTLNKLKDSPYFGDIQVYVPNIFSPNNDGVNDILRPFFSNNLNVYEAWFRVYERPGGLLFEAHATAPMTGPGLTGAELGWDGYFNGLPLGSAVYTWVLDYQNCSNLPAGCVKCSLWKIEHDECGNCDNPNHYGDSQLDK